MAGASVTKRRIDEFLQLVKRVSHDCPGHTKLPGYRGELATLRALTNALMLNSRFLSENCVGTLPQKIAILWIAHIARTQMGAHR